jgi:hypothetical protein
VHRRSCRDGGAISAIEHLANFGKIQLFEILARGIESFAAVDFGPDEPKMKAERVMLDIDQRDASKGKADVDWIEVSVSRKRTTLALAIPIVIKAPEHFALNSVADRFQPILT